MHRAYPENNHDGSIHHKCGHRVEQGREPSHSHGCGGQIVIGGVEACLFAFRFGKSADDAHARKIFIEGQSKPVDLLLVAGVKGRSLADDQIQDQSKDRCDGQ
ncbi:hypothetical protein SDC9_105088 [bioreactor metagenome]|uniref:Uncharacterized protein n=1 Tax=bioreactor metagenome TaxID=1076179 RepID=A0A645AYL6_9ZZZZ